MGQTKSKNCLPSGWRRLSESDCVHLLNDDELNNHHNPYVPNNQELFHQIYYPDNYSSNKWSASNTVTATNNTLGKCNNLGDEHFGSFPRNRSGSACMTTNSSTTHTTSSEATLLKFSKFENGDFVVNNNNNGSSSKPNQYNKNLFEASKNGSSLVRKSLPPCPAGKQQQPILLGPGSTATTPRHHARFAYPALLEPEMLMMRSSSLKHSRSIEENGRREEEEEEEMDDSRMVAKSFRQSDLIESPPPLTSEAMGQLLLNPFSSLKNPSSQNSSATMRPITMYQFEQFASSSGKAGGGSLASSGLTFSHHPAASSVTRGLSLSDLLEQCNALDEDDELEEEEDEGQFSDQTLVDTGGTMGPPVVSEEHEQEGKEKKNSNSKNCLLVDIGQSADGQLQTTTLRDTHHLQTLSRSANLVGGTPKGNLPPIRCSGLDCICDRCIGHRFKLLNWLLPNCTRINAERLLHGRMEGTFLVRKSEKFPGQYTLSFVCRRTVRHCLIMRSVYGFGLRWPYSFETLQQVIIHYARTTLAEFNSKLDVRLRYPVFMA